MVKASARLTISSQDKYSSSVSESSSFFGLVRPCGGLINGDATAPYDIVIAIIHKLGLDKTLTSRHRSSKLVSLLLWAKGAACIRDSGFESSAWRVILLTALTLRPTRRFKWHLGFPVKWITCTEDCSTSTVLEHSFTENSTIVVLYLYILCNNTQMCVSRHQYWYHVFVLGTRTTL